MFNFVFDPNAQGNKEKEFGNERGQVHKTKSIYLLLWQWILGCRVAFPARKLVWMPLTLGVFPEVCNQDTRPIIRDSYVVMVLMCFTFYVVYRRLPNVSFHLEEVELSFQHIFVLLR
jgi:hypothetical protein